MPRGFTSKPLTAADLRLKIKEIEDAAKERKAQVEEKIKALGRRAKFLKELKAWMERRKLTALDLLAMYRDLTPKRADKPVKSKMPLQPKGRWADKPRAHKGGIGKPTTARGFHDTDMMTEDGKLIPKRGDPGLRKGIFDKRRELGLTKEDIGTKLGVSGASVGNWESGRNVPKERLRAKLVKLLELPDDLGKETTAASMAAMGGRGQSRPRPPPNGAVAE